MINKCNEELKSNLNSIKGTTIALILTLTILVGISAYGLLTKENNSTFIALITFGNLLLFDSSVAI